LTVASQILRPTPPGGNKQKQPWVIQGPWGKRMYPPGPPSNFYSQLCKELGVPYASKKYRHPVTDIVKRYSWIEALGWLLDEPLAERLKRLRAHRGLTQEGLADKAQLPLNTLRQIEQGHRETPYWPTMCALARGLELPVTAFVGTEGWNPETNNEG
jgi:DNA-binding XRE family transcriptional regulator